MSHHRVLVGLFLSVFLSLFLCGTEALPLDCKPGSLSRCTSISQEKLLERVIEHAEFISRVSDESCALFEESFIPYSLRALRNQGGSACAMKTLPMPSSKTEIQQISDKWILHSVLILVQSWIEPLVYLQTTLHGYDDAPDTLVNRTKWVSEKLLSLEQGVVVLIRKMLDEGMLAPSMYDSETLRYELQPMLLEPILRNYNLLICFKKDAHKMETFLKLLKCRQTDNLNCSSF